MLKQKAAHPQSKPQSNEMQNQNTHRNYSANKKSLLISIQITKNYRNPTDVIICTININTLILINSNNITAINNNNITIIYTSIKIKNKLTRIRAILQISQIFNGIRIKIRKLRNRVRISDIQSG